MGLYHIDTENFTFILDLYRETFKEIRDLPLIPEQTPQSAIEESEPHADDECI